MTFETWKRRGLAIGTKFKIRPRNDVIPCACAVGVVKFHGNAQAGCAHRSFGVDSVDGLDETPGWNGPEFSLSGFEDTVAANDAPSVII